MKTCNNCAGTHKGDRKDWARCEQVRAKHQGWDRLPPEAIGPAPERIEWSLYPKASASRRISDHAGSFRDLFNHVKLIAHEIDGRGKGKGAGFSQPTYPGKTRSDQNCKAIYTLWFDCDGAGTWDELHAALKRSGVAHFLTESSSRSTTKWHGCVLLTAPRAFLQGDPGGRQEHKYEYHHIISFLSALAGFKGIGGNKEIGHCGLDLATDALVQLMFQATKRFVGDDPPRLVYFEGDALDWDTLLAATGFSLESHLESEGRTRVRASRGEVRPGTPFKGELGPLGVALKVANWLGHQKDALGVHARCPWSHEHSGGTGDWDAIYFPATDKWWCPHRACKTSGRHRSHLIEAMPALAKAVYDRELGLKPPKDEKPLPPVPQIAAWLEAQYKRLGADSHRILEAVVATILPLVELDEQYVVATAATSRPVHQARRLVRRVAQRLEKKKKTAGAPWLRRTLGVVAIYDLLVALVADLGRGVPELARRLFGLSRVQGDAARWVKGVAASLEEGHRAKGHTERPGWCWVTGYEVRALTVEHGDVTEESRHMCDSPGCNQCWLFRLAREIELLENGWEQNGRWTYPWKAQGPFVLHEISDIPDVLTLDKIQDDMRRWLRHPKLKVHTVSLDGKHGLLLVTNEPSANAAVPGVTGYWERTLGVKTKYTRTEDPNVALNAVALARLRLNVFHRSLIEQRDRDALVEWCDWLKGKHLVTKSDRSLPFPSREVMRAKAREKKGDKLKDALSVSYHGFNEQYGKRIYLNVQSYPPTFAQCIKLSKHHPSVVAAELSEREYRENKPEYDRIDRMLAAEERREELAAACS